ncbi:hypothetical protein DMC30DRAFT_401550 [Rhodotorula diobovata]|uniref:Uncharacterized protein n=1 Tax=Rhodotorula diobovata TaxID=5288 RepID=A0A5C5FT92_9BASI|nr:hypothetical protein DMC30DRAFT_401550 [Rhodotorula diobovata]
MDDVHDMNRGQGRKKNEYQQGEGREEVVQGRPRERGGNKVSTGKASWGDPYRVEIAAGVAKMRRNEEGGERERERTSPSCAGPEWTGRSCRPVALEVVVAQPELDLERADVGVLGPLEAVGPLARELDAQAFALLARVGHEAEGALALPVGLGLWARDPRREGRQLAAVFALVGIGGGVDGAGAGGGERGGAYGSAPPGGGGGGEVRREGGRQGRRRGGGEARCAQGGRRCGWVRGEGREVGRGARLAGRAAVVVRGGGRRGRVGRAAVVAPRVALVVAVVEEGGVGRQGARSRGAEGSRGVRVVVVVGRGRRRKERGEDAEAVGAHGESRDRGWGKRAGGGG